MASPVTTPNRYYPSLCAVSPKWVRRENIFYHLSRALLDGFDRTGAKHGPSRERLLPRRRSLLKCDRALQFRAVGADRRRTTGHRNDGDIEQLREVVAQ